MPQFNNYESLLNQASEEQLQQLGVVLNDDGSVDNLPALPVILDEQPIEVSETEAEQFAVDGQMPWQYARPTLESDA